MHDNSSKCPCKRINCERHGDCEACKSHHHAWKKYPLSTCERMQRRKVSKAKKESPDK